MQMKPWSFGPVALTTSIANLVNPGTTTGGVNSTAAPFDKLTIIIERIRIVNKASGAVTFSLYIGLTGGTAAGTEFMGTLQSIPANSFEDFHMRKALITTQFLTGLASANTSLTIEGDGQIGVG